MLPCGRQYRAFGQHDDSNYEALRLSGEQAGDIECLAYNGSQFLLPQTGLLPASVTRCNSRR